MSSLPVPSKAALTAMRGLILGTSCTLALFAEDRRRRINKALAFVENGERIKAAQSYRSGGAALALALEEEAFWDAGLLSAPPPFTMSPKLSRSQLGRTEAHLQDDTWARLELSSDEARLQQERRSNPLVSKHRNTSRRQAEIHNFSSTQTPNKPDSFIPPLADPRVALDAALRLWPAVDPKTVKALAAPSTEEIVSSVQDACHTKDARKLSSAINDMITAFQTKAAPSNLDGPWIEASALLCRTCQELGRVNDAANILGWAVTRGPLRESDYHDHDPLSLIRALLPQEPLGRFNRDAYVEKVEIATTLFLPNFTERPTDLQPEAFSLGKTLIELALVAERKGRLTSLYRRCSLLTEDTNHDFAEWYITKIHETGDFKMAIKLIITRYAKMSPSAESIYRVGDVAVQSVGAAHDHKADQVLKSLLEICSKDCKLKTEWVVRLMLSHRNQHRDSFEEVEALFNHVAAANLEDVVVFPDGVYRVMIEMALEAGEETKAESYMNVAAATIPRFAKDVRVQGLFALSCARAEDWEGVRRSFEKMGAKRADARGKVFVPILKLYAKQHTVHETEDFMRSYIRDFDVPLNGYMVTLMANQYGSLRDLDAFVGWIEYCASAGFKVDAAFTNAILANCRRQWKLPFRDLRTLFRKLRLLNPDFVDDVTGRIMTDAALMDSKLGGDFARGRLNSLRVKPNLRALDGRCAEIEGVVMAMKQAMVCKSPARALWIYKRALHQGIPPSQHALRLAVQAQLKTKENDYSAAFDLLQDARRRGDDIDEAVNYILLTRLGEILDGISSRKAAAVRAKAVEAADATLNLFASKGIILSASSLRRAALICLKAGISRAAIMYALKASKTVQEGPFYNLQNFKILLAAYTDLLDVVAIKKGIATALSSPYAVEADCLKALKRARQMVAGAAGSEQMEALTAIQDGIRGVVAAREGLREQASKLEVKAVDIMRQAALDANRRPVDFETIPWLNRKPKTRVDKRAGEGAVDSFDSAFDIPEDWVGKENTTPPITAVASF
ncbi:hypothetical protein B0T26DRAFT_646895 [Lasiosphaeria miniovina]|uniref:Uncharacterized protein n=1 Tax=Lasiosphaeria miniovina TaxID=1954250 RepID=A0AA40AM26_9PEZI|nr:uncharacterized protein B0T26DRAFT_646895 [Lasiosphaeria miniovina]KAK0718290.1 hypothetical protein B0T26DRAFT_646895 [Lasiosphaeria miniovina]